LPIYYLADGLHALSDEQWAKIAEISGIPSNTARAREELEAVICHYRDFVNADNARESPARLDKLFEEMETETRVFAKRLDCWNYFENYELISELPEELQELDDWMRIRFISNVVEDLRKIAQAAGKASARLKQRHLKRGPQTGRLYWLVAELGRVREKFTDHKITRSYKDDRSKAYITEVCRIANPYVSAGTVDAAMKAYIRARGRISRRADN